MFSFPVEIPLWQSKEHRNGNNDIFSIPWQQTRVIVPLLGVLVAVLDGCRVGTTWELLSLFRDARGLSGQCGVWCESNTRSHKRYSQFIPDHLLRLLIREMAGGCPRRRLWSFVFINQHDAGYQSQLSYLTSWTKKSQELEYIDPFFLPTSPSSFPMEVNTRPASWRISTSCDLHKTTPLVSQHTR